MRILRRPLLLLLCLEALGIILCIHEIQRLSTGQLSVAFLDIGQGDCALLQTPSGKRILIDGGRDAAPLKLIGERLPIVDRRIHLLILSHPQLDHIAAFPEILRRYTVDRILMTGVVYDLPQYREFLALIRERKIPVWIADPRRDIDLGDGVILDVVWPSPVYLGRAAKEVNNTSIMLRVLTGRDAILFTGDAEMEEESAALASGARLEADVLKVGHHGSKTSSGTGFLLAVRPRVGVVSAAKSNSYGHPHQMIVDRYSALNIPLRVTGWEGTIELIF